MRSFVVSLFLHGALLVLFFTVFHSRSGDHHILALNSQKLLENNRTVPPLNTSPEPIDAEEKKTAEKTFAVGSIEIELFQLDSSLETTQIELKAPHVEKRRARVVSARSGRPEFHRKILGPSPPRGLTSRMAKISTEISDGVANAITSGTSADGKEGGRKSLDAQRRGEPTPYRRKWFTNEEGDLELQSKAIAAVIGKDGQITIAERPLIEHKEKNIFHIRYTEWLTRKMGSDPFLSNKLAVLNETRSFRVDRIRRWNKKIMGEALSGLPAELENLWSEEKISLIERERLIRALLEECANTEEGKIAQRTIREFMNSKGIPASIKTQP